MDTRYQAINLSQDQTSVLSAPVLELRNLPQTLAPGSNFLAWTDTDLYRINGDLISKVNASAFTTNGSYCRWATADWYNTIWMTNPLTPLCSTDGFSITTLSPTPPSGKYLSVFYDYFLIGCPTWNGVYYPNRVQWCDLRNPNLWTPDPTNSADFFDFVSEDELSQFSCGVTGLKRITAGTTYRQRDYIAVYLPRSIRRLMYVGDKLVMQAHTSNDEIGCAFPYSVTGYSKLHAFIGEENFYTFDGFDPKIIGDNIKDYFFNDLSTNGDWRYRTWGYINKDKSELGWVYISQAQTLAPVFDKCVIWNFREDEWSVASVENIHSALQVSSTSGVPVINTHTEIINTDTEIINLLDVPTDFGKEFVYGSGNKQILRDATTADESYLVLWQPEPYIVTKDFTYDDLQHMKEVDQVTLHFDYDNDSCQGVQVYVSARNELGDAITWVPYPTLWTKDMPNLRLGGPRTYGRIYRFKFVWLKAIGYNAVLNAAFYGWGENVRLKDYEGKPLNVAA